MDGPTPAPPPGQVSNFDNPPSQAHIAVITVAVSLACVTPAVLLRLYTTYFINKKPKIDDALLVFCWLGFIAYSINMLESNRYGSFVDMWNVTASDLTRWRKLEYIEGLLYLILMFSMKSLVLILYRRLFSPNYGPMTWICWSIASISAYNTFYYCATIFATALGCTPTKKIWQPEVPGTCINLYAVMISMSSLDILSDFFMLILPVAVICRLKVPNKFKWEVVILLLSNLLNVVCTICRLIYSIDGSKNPNQTVTLAKIYLWTFGEIPACLFTSCLPMLPEFIRHFWPQLKDSKPAPEKTPQPYTEMDDAEANSELARSPSLTYPWLKSTDKVNISDEDPYYIYDESRDVIFNPDITVCTVVDVSSIPRSNKEGTRSSEPSFRNFV